MSTILIVDDDAAVRYTLQRVLAAHDFTAHPTANGKEALAYLKDHAVGLIITDIIMPEVEGIELIHTLRAAYPDLPILAISGGGRLDAREHLKMAEAFGASQTLRKPFDNDELIAAIRQFLPGTTPPANKGD